MSDKQGKEYGRPEGLRSVTAEGIPEYLTVADLAAKVQLHASTSRHEIQEGRLRAVKFDSYRIDPADVAEWLEARKVVCIGDKKPVTLRGGNRKETAFGEMARSMDRPGQQA